MCNSIAFVEKNKQVVEMVDKRVMTDDVNQVSSVQQSTMMNASLLVIVSNTIASRDTYVSSFSYSSSSTPHPVFGIAPSTYTSPGIPTKLSTPPYGDNPMFDLVY